MKFAAEVPEKEQIKISQFKLLPGDKVLIKVKKTFYHGRVVEVGAGSAEHTLWLQNGRKGPKPKIGMIKWKEDERKDADLFIRGQAGHSGDQPVRLRKSMWAVVEYTTGKSGPKTSDKRRKTLYTYDIEKMLKNDRLRIVGK